MGKTLCEVLVCLFVCLWIACSWVGVLARVVVQEQRITPPAQPTYQLLRYGRLATNPL